MRARYHVLCRVAMSHAYFASKQLRGVSTRPTAATAERLRRAGLLLRPLPTGFEVVYTAATDSPPPGLRSAFPLVFSLHPPGPDFTLYTDLPGATGGEPAGLAPGSVRYLAPRPAPDLQLHRGPVMGEADQLPLRPLAFDVVLPAGVRTATLSHYPDGPVVWEATNLPIAEPLTINLRAEGSGAYALCLGTAAPEVFFAADFPFVARPWAILEFGPAVLNAPGATYTLNLAARCTYWQYQLVSRQPLPNGLTIDVGAAPLFFEPVPASPGVAASLRASVAQPLAEYYPGTAYQLVLRETGRPTQVLCAALPHASPAGLRVKNNPVEQLSVTDIFVHL